MKVQSRLRVRDRVSVTPACCHAAVNGLLSVIDPVFQFPPGTFSEGAGRTVIAGIRFSDVFMHFLTSSRPLVSARYQRQVAFDEVAGTPDSQAPGEEQL